MTIDQAISLLTHAKEALGGATPLMMEDGCTEYYTEFAPTLRAAHVLDEQGERYTAVVLDIEDQPSPTGEGTDAELPMWLVP